MEWYCQDAREGKGKRSKVLVTGLDERFYAVVRFCQEL